MATDLIRYDLLVQDALRGVVRTVLAEAARNGLQGEHHFFITFKTNAPGLRLSDRMRERYPDEMTIILQHQFWDLGVSDHAFEVGLSFSNKPERLLVPFAAITTFHDPSVQFGLKFDLAEKDATEGAAAPAADAGKPPSSRKKLAAVETTGQSNVAETPVAALPAPGKSGDKPAKPALSKVPTLAEAAKDKSKAESEPTKVVSIDAFRKKP